MHCTAPSGGPAGKYYELFLLVSFLSRPLQIIASPVIVESPTGNISVIDSNTLQPIPQFPATDGGAGMVNNIIWIAFSMVLALPMAVAGVRAGRIAIGAAIGLTAAMSVWASFVNSLPMQLSSTINSSDLILTLIVLATFLFFAFIGAFLRFLYLSGLILLGACAGISLMIRVIIIRPGLLVPLNLYPLDILLVVLGAVLGGVAMFWRRRWCVIISTSFIATFFIALSVDLIVHSKSISQQGIGRGLRLLLDRNPSHTADILGIAYKPSLATQLTLGISIAIIPIFIYLQHRLFPSRHFQYALRPTETFSIIGGDLEDIDTGTASSPDRLLQTPTMFRNHSNLRKYDPNIDTEIEMMGTLRGIRDSGGVRRSSSRGGGDGVGGLMRKLSKGRGGEKLLYEGNTIMISRFST